MVIVYKLTNKKNEKSLIGYTSKDLDSALKLWMSNCGRKNYADYDITKDFKQYGKEVFTIERLIMTETLSEAKEIVDTYIDKYQTLQPNGYNTNYMGIRKMNPDYYEKRKENQYENLLKSTDNDLTIGEKKVLEKEMESLYGLDNLIKPTNDNNYATKEVIEGLRTLANDLEKYGNIDVLSVIPKKLNEELGKNGKNIEKLLNKRTLINPDKEYSIVPDGSIQCMKCGKYYAKDMEFYTHIDKEITYDGYIHICKHCIADYCKKIYETCNNVVFTLISLCQILNIVFIQEIAEKVSEQWGLNKDKPENIGKYYFSELKYGWAQRKDTPSTLMEFRNSHFIGDIFSFEQYSPATPKVFIKDLNQNLVEEKMKNDKTTTENMEAKWGKGFTTEEYEAMEEEFNKLEKFLGKKTDLHIEALKKYIIYNSKEKLALAEGKDLKEVKEWSALADKAAENAQLKIKQLTGDFGDGVDSFSQLAETVEEYYSAIPTLPKARKMPYDDMDFLIWQIVNYIRRLEGKPETTYEEVYSFYDEELTKKMRDSGMTDEEINLAKEQRNAIFKDLSDAYQEPLWLLPEYDDDDNDEEEEGL